LISIGFLYDLPGIELPLELRRCGFDPEIPVQLKTIIVYGRKM